MIPHQAQCDIGSVRQPVRVPLLDVESLAQIGEIGGVFAGIEGAEIDPLADQAIVTGRGRHHVHHSSLGVIVGKADGDCVKGIDLGAGQQRLGVQDPALIHDDEIAVLSEAEAREE
jgi:hypothetical protein